MESELAQIVRYLERAVELRETAAQMPDQTDREALLKAADASENMAGWKPDRK